MSIPTFNNNGNLPEGIHLATWQEVEESFAFNARRQELLSGLRRACKSLKQASCPRIYIGGSFVTNKEFPGDFDVCWESQGVDRVSLQAIDPVFFDMSNKRATQKAKYEGEFFRANTIADPLSGKTYLDFFKQIETEIPRVLLRLISKP